MEFGSHWIVSLENSFLTLFLPPYLTQHECRSCFQSSILILKWAAISNCSNVKQISLIISFVLKMFGTYIVHTILNLSIWHYLRNSIAIHKLYKLRSLCYNCCMLLSQSIIDLGTAMVTSWFHTVQNPEFPNQETIMRCSLNSYDEAAWLFHSIL